MNLQRFSLLLAVVAASLGMFLAAALVIMTTALRVSAQRIGASVESVAISEDIGLQLVSLRNSADPAGRTAHAESVRRLATEAARYVGSAPEAVVLQRLTASIDRFVDLKEQSPDAPSRGTAENLGSSFEAAIGAARELRHINIDQSRALAEAATRWDRAANVFGVVAVAVFAIGLGAVAWWLQQRAFSPVMQLVGSIERYAQGDRSARAPEEGPAEFRSIARRFNDMASTLQSQRSAQLAFLAGVAHDLRNPLSALKMAVGIVARDEPLPSVDQMRQLFGVVQRQTDRMERMVSDLLDAARIEAGNLEIRMERCDVCELVRAVINLFEPTTHTHHLVADVQEAPVHLMCDPGRIEQVLTNLVSNAIKYSPHGGNVRVAVAGQEGMVVITVADDGIGMSSQEIDGVFEAFRRTETSKEAIPGVGLGLFVARRIVDAHGGRISVTSTVGKGSAFAVSLPVEPKGEQVRPPADPALRPDSSDSTAGPPPRATPATHRRL